MVTSLDQDKLNKALPRLKKEANIWLGTVRADGRPHLIPIWFIWHEEKVWICTGKGSQKHVNLRHNPHVALALEDGSTPIILEGTAAEADDTTRRDELAPLFVEKYDWDFRTDTDEDWLLMAIVPRKILSW